MVLTGALFPSSGGKYRMISPLPFNTRPSSRGKDPGLNARTAAPSPVKHGGILPRPVHLRPVHLGVHQLRGQGFRFAFASVCNYFTGMSSAKECRATAVTSISFDSLSLCAKHTCFHTLKDHGGSDKPDKSHRTHREKFRAKETRDKEKIMICFTATTNKD